MKATNDPTVQPFEAEEIRSDMKALDARWSSLKNKTEKQRNRFASFIDYVLLTIRGVQMWWKHMFIVSLKSFYCFKDHKFPRERREATEGMAKTS